MLIPPGETRATTDPEIAERLLHRLVRKLKEQKKRNVLVAIDPGRDLSESAIHRLAQQAASDAYDAEELMDAEAYLNLAVDYFTRWQHASIRRPEPLPRRRSLASIGISDVRAFNEWLKSTPDQQGSHRPAASRRQILRALSNVFDTAII